MKHKHAMLVKAWADGAEIQHKSPHIGLWLDTSFPEWHDRIEYRVKQQWSNNMTTKHKHHELIKAWADGARIEVQAGTPWNSWLTATNPNWDPSNQYRIRPAEACVHDTYLKQVINQLKLAVTKQACKEADNQLYTERLNVIKLQADIANLKKAITQAQAALQPEIPTP